MANGAAALHVLDEPAAAAPTEIDLAIGEATAAAACMIAAAMMTHLQIGRLTDEIRATGSERLARVSRLQLDNLDKIDFDAIARQQGLVILRRQLADTDVFRQHGADAVERALNNFLDGALEIKRLAVADELAFLRARTN